MIGRELHRDGLDEVPDGLARQRPARGRQRLVSNGVCPVAAIGREGQGHRTRDYSAHGVDPPVLNHSTLRPRPSRRWPYTLAHRIPAERESARNTTTMPTMTRRQLLRSAAGSSALLSLAAAGPAVARRSLRGRLAAGGRSDCRTPRPDGRRADRHDAPLRQSLDALRSGRQRRRPQRARRQARGRFVRAAGMAGAQEDSGRDGPIAGQAGDRHALAFRSHRQQPPVPKRRRRDPGASQHEEADVADPRRARHALHAVAGGRATDPDVRRRAQAADERRADRGRAHSAGAHRYRCLRVVHARQCAAHGRRLLPRCLPVHRRGHRRQHQRADCRRHIGAETRGQRHEDCPRPRRGRRTRRR